MSRETVGSATTIQIRDKGIITVPVELRRQYGLNPGDVLTLIDLGDGTFLLTAQVSQVARQGDEVARLMAEQGVALDEVLEALDRERESYYTDLTTAQNHATMSAVG